MKRSLLYLTMQASHFKVTCLGILLLFFWGLQSLSAQNWLIQQFTDKDGLPHNIGYGILQDQQGFLWIGTDNGLAQFDGTTFNTFNERDGLEGPYIIEVSEDPSGQILVSSYRKGVLAYQNPQFINTGWIELPNYKITEHHPKLYFFKDEIFYLDIRNDLNTGCLVHEKKGVKKPFNIYPIDGELTFHEIVAPLDYTAYKLRFNTLDEKEMDFRIFVNKAGRMYWATPVGFYEYLGDLEFRLIKKGNFSRITGNNKGDICLVEEHKIWHWDGKEFQVITSNVSQPVEQIQMNDQKMVIWFGQEARRLHFMDIPQKREGNLDGDLSNKAPFSQMTADRQGNFWLTTQGDGVFRITPSICQHIELRENPEFHNVISIVEKTPKLFWVGTEKGLFSIKKGSQDAWGPDLIPQLPDLLKKNQISRLVSIRESYHNNGPLIVVGSNKGIYEYHLPSQQFQYTLPIENNYTGFDNRGRTYIRLGNGIYCFEDSIEKGKRELSPTVSASKAGLFGDLVAKNPTRIWYASHAQVVLMMPDSTASFSVSNGLPDSVTYDLAFDRDSNLWVAGRQGIAMFQDGKFIPHPQNNIIKGGSSKIAFDQKGGIWVGGGRGVYYVQEDKVLQLNNTNGLPTNAVNELYFDSQDRLWVGTVEGLDLVKNPSELKQTRPPRIQIETLLVNGESSDSLPASLPMNSDIFTKIRVIDDGYNGTIQVAYRLRKTDAWTFLSNREFSFNNLSPNQYDISFKAKTLNSEWSEVLTLEVEIKPPIWQRWWAIIIGLVLISLLAFWIIRKRIQNIRKRADAQNELNKQMAHLQLSALQAQLNPHFIFNALNSIQYFILSQDEIAANDYLTKFSRLMRLFLEASHSRTISLSEELELLALYIELEQLRFEGLFDYEINLEKGLDPEDIEVPSMMLQPFVENAINHGLRHKEGLGFLQINFEKAGEEVICVIEDDGIGKEASQAIKARQEKNNKSYGMELLEDRIEVLNQIEGSQIAIQTIDLYDSERKAAGTRVEIRLPI